MKAIFTAANEMGVITVGGGGGFTAEPLLFSEMCGVDYAVIGEGDFSVCELIDALSAGSDVSAIKGLVYRQSNGAYAFTGHRAPIADLDAIPFPSYEGLPIETQMVRTNPLSEPNTFYTDEPRIIPITYSRSCPYKCAFCFHPTGDRYRSRSMDSFFAELDTYVARYEINGLTIVDECFRMDDSVYEFCERIKPYGLKWAVSLVAKTVTREKLAVLKDAGCFFISYGIESMSEAVLTDMNKPADVKTLERALELTAQAGISFQGVLIFGAEAETSETVKETLSWWLNNRKYQLILNIVTPYPGSAYFERCVTRGIIKDKRKYIELGCPWVNFSKLTDHEYERLITLISLPLNAKIAWDFGCHGEIIKTEPNYKGNAGLVSVTLKCSHCGATHTYGNLPAAEAAEAFYMPCRSCGLLTTYGPYPDYNWAVLSQWLRNEASGVRLSDWLTDNGIKSVIIYGLGNLGIVVYKYIEKLGLVAAVTDRNPQAASTAYTFMGDTRFVALDEIKDTDADLILVTLTDLNKQIRTTLSESGHRIETLFDIVFGITAYASAV
jgi:radical SAM superfamily enzyme YgiQ (UPF0313 family)